MKQTARNDQLAARAGRYVTQPEGYRAFVPNPLPPDPELQMDHELQTLLSNADRALGRLDGSIQTLPDPDLFVFMYVRKEAVLSNQIEGTMSSINDVLEVEARVMNPERPRDVAEVLNYVGAMNYGLERLTTLPLSVRLIRKIHERLMQGVRGKNQQPGEFRRSQNWIGSPGCAISEAIYVPPPAHMVEDKLNAIEKFIHKRKNMPDLIEAGLLHAQFETIHTFLDGNGRIGRLLITFLLCNRKILLDPVLYLSYYFKEKRKDYYALLQAVRDRGDWESWLKFFLTAVATVSNEATDTARNIVDLREKHRSLITSHFGRAAGNGLKALEFLFRNPIVNVKSLKELLGITYPAANKLIARLVYAEILSELTGRKRNRQRNFLV